MIIACFLAVIIFTIYLFYKFMPEDTPAALTEKKVRQPAVAGQFYPGGKDDLSKEINRYLEAATSTAASSAPKALIVPHAGYDYSAPVAAYAFKSLAGSDIKRVILIGNSHRNYFPGLAVDDHSSWQTPLGEVEVDLSWAKDLTASYPFIKSNGALHDGDHVLEVELPFLQTILKNKFKIVPILFGNSSETDYLKFAEALENKLTDGDLVVVSSDLSHYPTYEDAKKIDQETLRLVEAGDIANLDKHKVLAEKTIANEQTVACGLDAIKTVMALAKKLDWQTKILKYQNSGDSQAGDKSRVVGYGVVQFSETKTDGGALNKKQKEILVGLAKNTVESYVLTGRVPGFKNNDPRLEKSEGAFVTIKKNGQLRGCIGQIIGRGPLWQTVREMAVAAASQDSRFSPVEAAELPQLKYEVSVLSAPKKIVDWQKIKLGEQGVIVKKGYSSGVFLPQVATETGWDLETFLDELCSQKAGLPSGCYKNDPKVELQVFTAQVF